MAHHASSAQLANSTDWINFAFRVTRVTEEDWGTKMMHYAFGSSYLLHVYLLRSQFSLLC